MPHFSNKAFNLSKYLIRTPLSQYSLPDLYIWSETSCDHKVKGLSSAAADASTTDHLSCQNVLEQKTGPLPVHSLEAVWTGEPKHRPKEVM